MIYNVIRSHRDKDGEYEEVVARGLTLDVARQKANELGAEYRKANPGKSSWTGDLFGLRLDKKLMEATPEILTLLTAASHALRSYQYGNSATDLAKEIADKCDDLIRRVGVPA
jgi:hypothetical protein